MIDGDGSVDLIGHSTRAILQNQAVNGAIVASPDFEQYDFCWLRDGSFTSFALDLVGEFGASARYHAWANQAIGAITEQIESAIGDHRAGRQPDLLNMPPARFTLEGKVVVDGWPNFQIDGYGTWLWSLSQHLELSNENELPSSFRQTVKTVARYLSEFAFVPCFDVWEESGDAVHTSTLASAFGGLVAASQMLDTDEYMDGARSLQAKVVDDAARLGYFAKSNTNPDVDASSLWLATPFNLVDVRNECFQETVNLIEQRLTLDGGIRRYSSDTYYGSGAWPVLTASLGWNRAQQGDLDGAKQCRVWIEDRFTAEFCLGEQFGGDKRDPEHFSDWVNRWGLPANDLMWSHAMYIVLSAALEKSQSKLNQSSLDRGGG